MAEEEKEFTSQEDEQTETTEKVDNSLEEDLKIFMADIQGQITNLTQMIEKNNSVADEKEEETEDNPDTLNGTTEPTEETETDDSEVEELLKDI